MIMELMDWNSETRKTSQSALLNYFDHYLEDTLPKWMTLGRPAKLKQIDDRFELDPEGSCGDSCKICREKISGSRNS